MLSGNWSLNCRLARYLIYVLHSTLITVDSARRSRSPSEMLSGSHCFIFRLSIPLYRIEEFGTKK